MSANKGIETVIGGAAAGLIIKTSTSSTDVPALLELVKKHGVVRVDSAVTYGASEELLGEYGAGSKYGLIIDTKLPGSQVPGSMQKDSVIEIGNESLKKLKVSQVDILYIHCPDDSVPIDSALEGINELHKAGMFRRFGLSNFLPAQVREVYDKAKAKGYVLPTVYQGNYNAFARHYESPDATSQGLLPLLRELGISFYAYSPAAGGFLSKPANYFDGGVITGGRFDTSDKQGAGQIYNALYNKPTLIQGLKQWNAVAKEAGIKPLAMALRWVKYNSYLKPEHGDAIIVGGRTLEQVDETLGLLEDGPLDEKTVKGIDDIWEVVRGEAPTDNFTDFMKENMARMGDIAKKMAKSSDLK